MIALGNDCLVAGASHIADGFILYSTRPLRFLIRILDRLLRISGLSRTIKSACKRTLELLVVLSSRIMLIKRRKLISLIPNRRIDRSVYLVLVKLHIVLKGLRVEVFNDFQVLMLTWVWREFLFPVMGSFCLLFALNPLIDGNRIVAVAFWLSHALIVIVVSWINQAGVAAASDGQTLQNDFAEMAAIDGVDLVLAATVDWVLASWVGTIWLWFWKRGVMG